MTILQVKPRCSTFDARTLQSAWQYCNFKPWTDWYVEAVPTGQGTAIWLHWAVDTQDMQALFDAELSCIDFKPANKPDYPWVSIEELPEGAKFTYHRFYLCRYILSVDP